MESKCWIWGRSLILQTRAMVSDKSSVKTRRNTCYVLNYITFHFKMRVRIPPSQSCYEDQIAWVIMCPDHCSYLTNANLYYGTNILLTLGSSILLVFFPNESPNLSSPFMITESIFFFFLFRNHLSPNLEQWNFIGSQPIFYFSSQGRYVFYLHKWCIILCNLDPGHATQIRFLEIERKRQTGWMGILSP